MDTELCNDCQTCVSERFFFNDIEMRKTLTSKKKKAHVLAETCMGCGSCILGCEQKAITFELVRPLEHILSEKNSTYSFPTKILRLYCCGSQVN